jgi:hypothetical protein
MIRRRRNASINPFRLIRNNPAQTERKHKYESRRYFDRTAKAQNALNESVKSRSKATQLQNKSAKLVAIL